VRRAKLEQLQFAVLGKVRGAFFGRCRNIFRANVAHPPPWNKLARKPMLASDDAALIAGLASYVHVDASGNVDRATV